MTKRILVIAHGHREFSAGGAEVAADQLFTSLKDEIGEENVFFLARHEGRHLNGMISHFRRSEYIWSVGITNWFKFQTSLPHSIYGSFRDFLARVRPNIVFIHHYANIGLEMLREIRHTCPDARVVLTLHEYYAMCSNGGQMVKSRTNELCFSALPEACTVCFPERSEEDFWLRKHFIRRHFDAVDRFIAPSEFLRQRYIDWGIAPDRIAVIENGQPSGQRLPPRPLTANGTRNRFAFFGQVTPFKGVDALLAALANLSRSQRRELHVEIHGANLEKQPEAFRARIEALRQPLMKEGVLHWPGAYHRDDLERRMARIDWVLVPSIWWENSPVVIQEARRFGRPILCSNIGGMAEHVRDGVDGLHVGVGNVTDWGESLLAATDPDRWDRLVQSLRPPVPIAAAARQYLDWALDDTPRQAPELPRVISGRV